VRTRLALSLLIASSLAVPVAAASPASAADAPYGEMVVTFLDVGQGESAYYVGPCGEAGLVDAGDGSTDAVTGLMDAVGGHELEFATASHYDADHIGDFADIGSYPGVTVGAVYDRGGGATAKDTAAYEQYYEWAESTGGHQAVDIGDVFSLCDGEDEVTFTVVSAGTDGTAAAGKPVTEENDRGLCLHVEFGDLDIATCGDINGTDEGERSDVESAVAPVIGEVEVAKVNHHGSAYSSNQTYIDTLAAEIAVLSVGDNSYGHPDQDVVDRWMAESSLFQTGAGAGNMADGNLQVYSDGKEWVEIISDSGYETEYVLDERPGSGSPLEPDPGTEPEPEPEPTTGPRALDGSCPAGQIAYSGFADVPAGSTHAAAVDCVVHWQITNGRTAGSYDPLTPVTRAQMASFIARLVDRASGYLPDVGGYDYFNDDNGSVHERNINRLAAAGVVGGKAPFTYDPNGRVTRAQMAAFLTRAYDYRATQHGAETLWYDADYFPDDETSPLQKEINKAAHAGFTSGYGDGTYRPGGDVRRDQMASFLARVLDLVVEEGMTTVPAAPTPEPAPVPVPVPQPAPGPSQPADPGDTKNCGDFDTWRQAQDWFESYYPYYGDVAGLDGNNDMVACEGLPGAP
jgi:beta-lactamase superfamily II metal-dependent hydrolase